VVAVVDVPSNRRTSTNTRTTNGQGFVELAEKHSIPAYEPAKPNGPEFVQTMRDLQPDLFLAVGYLPRFREVLLGIPRLLTVNFHASLLPAYRGLHPVFRTLRGGERWAGLTVHVVDPGLDTGDVLYQVRVRTRRDDSVVSLYDRIMGRSVGLVGQLIADAQTGRLRRRAQGEAGASYFSSVSEEDFRIDWHRDAEQLRRWICTTPGRCFCDVGGERVYFADPELVKGVSAAPGTLVSIGRTRCIVAAGREALSLGRLRAQEGELPAADWCRKHGLKVGGTIECHSSHFVI
jgi:methionyl-tRNA formyltransferase